MKGGYRHGKRSEALPSSKPRLEDRIETLEKLVAGLLRLARGALEREQETTHHELAELAGKKAAYMADKKKTVLKRTLKKPVKRKRGARK